MQFAIVTNLTLERNSMDEDELKRRTKRFGLRIMKLARMKRVCAPVRAVINTPQAKNVN